MKNRNFQIDDLTHKRLKALAAERGWSIGQTIRHLINAHKLFELTEERTTCEIHPAITA